MLKFDWYISPDGLNDRRILDLLMNYQKKTVNSAAGGQMVSTNVYEVSENVYKAMRSLIQNALKENAFSYLIGEGQDIVLYQKKHFRINKGDEDIFELALGYAELQGISRDAVRNALTQSAE